MAAPTLFLGEVWTATDDSQAPFSSWSKGAVVVKNGLIADVGFRDVVEKAWPGAIKVPFSGVLAPGFIDTHVHFPQLDIIGSYGEELLGWLNTYTYPAEKKFCDKQYAAARAPRFFQELLANGTTTAAVYASSHIDSAKALFEAAKLMNLTMIIGKVSMDREGPAALLQAWQDDAKDNKKLIAQYHDFENRLFCALTPRFAIACSEAMLQSLGEIRAENPSLYIQTHHGESLAEVAATKKLFPSSPHYAGVYDRYGLLTDKTILGHCIHITKDEMKILGKRRCAVAHCPTSNAFLGSGLFAWNNFTASDVAVGLATDVGAGTSLSMWRTMAMAYKLQSLRGRKLTPEQLFYHATLGGAKVLQLDHKLGRIAPGYRADFQIIDPSRHRLLKERFRSTESVRDRLFSCMILADDRLVSQVYIAGEEVQLPSV